MSDDFKSWISEEKLLSLYNEKLSLSFSRGRDGIAPNKISESQLVALIGKIYSKITSNSYEFSPYKQVLKLKSAHSLPRLLAVPDIDDRILHLALSKYLLELDPPIGRMKRPQVIVSEIKNSIKVGTFTDFIRFDIKNFYPSVPHDLLLLRLKKLGCSDYARDLLDQAISAPIIPTTMSSTKASKTEKGIPAGTSIATVLGEIYLSVLEEKFLNLDELKYFRYVDDILILSEHGQRTSIKNSLVRSITDLKLAVHSNKNGDKAQAGKLNSSHFQYLGYTFKSKTLTVNEDRQKNLISNLASPITRLNHTALEKDSQIEKEVAKAKWWFDLRITGCIAQGSRRGWLHYYSQIIDVSLLHKLDTITSLLIRRLPKDRTFEPKSFLKSYHYIHAPNRDTENYIINFDEIKSAKEIRQLLEIASDYTHLPKDAEKLKKLFKKFISFAIKELDVDVGSPS